jgi:hypothetical protein
MRHAETRPQNQLHKRSDRRRREESHRRPELKKTSVAGMAHQEPWEVARP